MTELEKMLIAYTKDNGACELCAFDTEENSACNGCCDFCDNISCDCRACHEFSKYKFDIEKLKKYLDNNKIEW